MDKIDFIKQDKQFYTSKAEAEVVEVPEMRYLMFDGSGVPEGNPEFQRAMQALYGVAYTVKFMPKKGDVPPGYRDFKVPPPEGLWWMEGKQDFDMARPKDWRWTLMIRMPDFVTDQVVDTAIAEMCIKKKDDVYKQVRLGRLKEGRSIQVMHIGPYDQEQASFDKMDELARQLGAGFRGKHHEIYFGDPRRTKPEKLKTLLRHPLAQVEQNGSRNIGGFGMGLFKKVSLLIGSAVAVMAIGAGVAFAAGNESIVSGTTDHSVYKAGQTVTITGTVNGDIFCAGQTVTIDATVNGDVVCAGQSVTVDGTVRGNVRVAGQTVNIGANIERSVSLAAQDATLQSNAKVGGDVGVVGQTATIDGVVGRDVRGAGHTLIVSDKVGRNVDSTSQRLELNNQAAVGGNLTYTSPNRLKQSGGATVAGSVTYHKSAPARPDHRIAHLWVIRSLYVDLALLVFSLVLVALLPQLFGRLNKLVSAKPWQPLLTGFLAMFIVPVLIIALVLTLVGAPLAVFTGLAWLLLLFLSAPVSAFYIGKLILRQEKRAPLIMLVGAVVLGLVCLVPVLGGIVTMVAMWFGTGSLLLNLKARYQKPQYRV